MVYRNLFVLVLLGKVASALEGLNISNLGVMINVAKRVHFRCNWGCCWLLIWPLQKKNRKMIETLANGYSSESTPQELTNEYQHDRVWMVPKKS